MGFASFPFSPLSSDIVLNPGCCSLCVDHVLSVRRTCSGGNCVSTWMRMLGSLRRRRRLYTASWDGRIFCDCSKKRRVPGKSSFGRHNSRRRKGSSGGNCVSTWMQSPPTTSAVYSKLRRADLLRFLEEEKSAREEQLRQAQQQEKEGQLRRELCEYMDAHAGQSPPTTSALYTKLRRACTAVLLLHLTWPEPT